MRLEPEMWDALREICAREGMMLRDLILQVERTAPEGCRTSAVRVHVLQYFRAAATDDGHRSAGHGGVPPSAGLPARSDAARAGAQ
jgi:predicted DNA-binding ribbon-helix-helix protein